MLYSTVLFSALDFEASTFSCLETDIFTIILRSCLSSLYLCKTPTLHIHTKFNVDTNYKDQN